MANIFHDDCALLCRKTWWRTNDVATGPGEVRYCNHGEVWIWSHRENSRLDVTSFDVWRHLHRRRDRKEYRRAVEALDAEKRARPDSLEDP